MEPEFKRARLVADFHRFQGAGVISPLKAESSVPSPQPTAVSKTDITSTSSSSATIPAVSSSSSTIVNNLLTSQSTTTVASAVDTSSSSKEDPFKEFYVEMKEFEVANASGELSRQHIARLTRPGATYFNLNPFDVLQLDADTPMTECKKRYRQLVLFVHPDKNLDDKERAEKAFQSVEKAWGMLNNQESFEHSKEVYAEAKSKVDEIITEQRLKQKREGVKNPTVPEDDPVKYKQSIHVQACKLFAELERLRMQCERHDEAEKKKLAEDEQKAKEELAQQKEFQKNFEATRDGRVASWNSWMKSSGGKSAGLKPPKRAAETVPGAGAKGGSGSAGTFKAASYHSLSADPELAKKF